MGPLGNREKMRRMACNDRYVTCLLCGKAYVRITASHLRKHGMTIAEYRERFGLHYVSSVSFRRNISQLKRRRKTAGRYSARSESEIIRDLKRWAHKRSPLAYKWLWCRDPTLAKQAVDAFGTWSDAVRAAGIEDSGRRSWSRDEVLAAIQARAKRGKPLGARAVIKDDLGLYEAAKRHCGSWRSAIQQARQA